MDESTSYCAYMGPRLLTSGSLSAVLSAAKGQLDATPEAPLLIFDEQTGAQLDFDFGGTLADVLARALPTLPERPGPGRPKLGVISREISLLPRHWRWLELEPQGISAALRRLVDEARKRIQARSARAKGEKP